jgi:hypothetical protein
MALENPSHGLWHPTIGAATVGNPNKKIVRCYQLTPPDRPKFQAAILEEGGSVHVISNRSGNWKPDEALHFADLILPEQALNEWDVILIEPDQLEDFGA